MSLLLNAFTDWFAQLNGTRRPESDSEDEEKGLYDVLEEAYERAKRKETKKIPLGHHRHRLRDSTLNFDFFVPPFKPGGRQRCQG